MILNITFVILLTLSVGVVAASRGDIGLGDVPIPEASGGRFVLKGLRVSQEKPGRQARISGGIDNQTRSVWHSVDFEVVLTDKSGEEIAISDGCFYLSKLDIDKPESSSCVFEARFDRASLRILRAQRTKGWVNAVYRFSLISPRPSTTLAYEDERIALTLLPAKSSIGLKVRNKTPDVLKLDWNQSSYVDQAGRSSRLIHSGVRFVEKNSLLPPSIIPPGAVLEDSIVPVAAIKLVGARWFTDDLLPVRLFEASQMKGRAISVLVCIEANGTPKNYMLTFRIDDVTPD